MAVNGIGAGYPAWRKTGKIQRNHSEADFANQIAGMVSKNDSESNRKTNAISGRDNYVGGHASDSYSLGIYSRKDASVPQKTDGLSNHVNDLSEKTKPETSGNQESETKTKIIVKPDGSRVLVMTMSIGGMETTMSLEISKPTKMPNDHSKQDTTDMPTAENNTVSDEMQDHPVEIGT